MAQLKTIMVLAIISLVMLFGLTASSSFFTAPPREPTTAVVDQVTIMMQIIVPLMFALVTVAVVVYMVGQMFGAETRARATVWAHGVIIAVGLSALIIASIYIILPGFFSGQVDWDNIDVVDKIIALRNATESFLAALTLVLVVLAVAVYVPGMLMGAETRARANTWASGLIGGAIFTSIIYILLSTILPQFETTFFSGGVPGAGLDIYGFVIIQIVFFVAFFILITYLISKVFKVPEWEAYLNIEFSNLVNSFLIVIFIVALFGFGTVVALSFGGSGYNSPPQAAISYMQGTVADSALRAASDVYMVQACTSILSTFTRRIGEFVLTQTYKVFPGLDTFVSITNVLSLTLVSLYSTVSVQISMMYMVDVLMVPFFLPAGLILRFLPPTRDAGAFLIAVAFGFQIIFPTTYLINKQIYHEIGAKAYNEPGERPTLLINSLCGPFKYGVAGYLFNPSANRLFDLIPGGATIGNAFMRIFSEGLLNAVSMTEFIPVLKHIAALSLLVLFMPALSMMITIAFINAMTKFIVAKV